VQHRLGVLLHRSANNSKLKIMYLVGMQWIQSEIEFPSWFSFDVVDDEVL
jgi:hypothetical protein